MQRHLPHGVSDVVAVLFRVRVTEQDRAGSRKSPLNVRKVQIPVVDPPVALLVYKWVSRVSIGLLLREQNRMQTREARQRLLDPSRVLGRGYALVRDKKSRILTGVASMSPGQELDIELRDGHVAAVARKIDSKKKREK